MLFLAYLAALTSAYDVNEELKSNLAQMPLNTLVHIKRLFLVKTADGPIAAEERALPDTVNSLDPPGALKLKGDWMRKPLKKRQNHLKRGDWVEDWNRKGGKLQHVFASTITILAFLAFGGYLITMIVLALRNNQGLLTPLAPTQSTVTTVAASGRKRRAVEESPFVDDAVESMHRLARGYTCYHALNASNEVLAENEEKYCA